VTRFLPGFGPAIQLTRKKYRSGHRPSLVWLVYIEMVHNAMPAKSGVQCLTMIIHHLVLHCGDSVFFCHCHLTNAL